MVFVTNYISIVIVTSFVLISNKSTFARRPAGQWTVKFERKTPIYIMELGEKKIVNFQVSNLNKTELTLSSAKIRAVSNSDVLRAYQEISVSEINQNEVNGSIQVEAIFIGGAHVYVEIVRSNKNSLELDRSPKYLPVQVMRKRVPEYMYSEFYTIYENVFYWLIRVFFGIVIDWRNVAANIRYPTGIAISFFCTYIFMPMTSYVLGYVIFPDYIEMQFVLIIIGSSVLRAVSNLWTVILEGNIDLSITISLVNMVLACGMIPLWILTITETTLPENAPNPLKVKYYYVLLHMFNVIFPLFLGTGIRYCIQCCCLFIPKEIEVQLLRFFSVIYITSTTFYAISSFSDLLTSTFSFTWKFYLAGSLLPFLGYSVTSVIAYACGFMYQERVAIAVETVNFNTVIAIATSISSLKGYSKQELVQFLSNLNIIMTPIPLLVHFAWSKIRMSEGSVKISK